MGSTMKAFFAMISFPNILRLSERELMDKSDVLNIFNPVVKEWFLDNIGLPSLPQIEGWPQIQSGKMC